jgi:hypothetical protein
MNAAMRYTSVVKRALSRCGSPQFGGRPFIGAA